MHVLYRYAQCVACCLLPLLIGCATPLAESRDSAETESKTASLFDVDGATDSVKQTAKTLMGKGYNPTKAKELYSQAEAEYLQAMHTTGEGKQDRYEKAAGLFYSAAERWPDSAMEQDALYMAGEAYYFSNRFPKSNDMFERLLQKYPNSKYLDRAESRRFSIAQYWLELDEKDHQKFWEYNVTNSERPLRDQFGNAVRVFDKIRIDDPTGKLADDATLAAGNAYFRRGKYIEADNFYTDLRKTFPSSEHQFRAHLLGVKAKLQAYEGPDYSGDALVEAEKLIKQINRQFPQQAQEERDYLARAYAEVKLKQAEREMFKARYYDRRREYGAARHHYNRIVSDYSRTPYAEQATERLAEIGDRPDVPEQQLEWLVDMFPDEEQVQPLIASQPTGSSTR